MYTPDPLYEFMPMLYLIAGLVAFSAFDGLVATIFGDGLVLLAAFILNLRFYHRSSKNKVS